MQDSAQLSGVEKDLVFSFLLIISPETESWKWKQGHYQGRICKPSWFLDPIRAVPCILTQKSTREGHTDGAEGEWLEDYWLLRLSGYSRNSSLRCEVGLYSYSSIRDRRRGRKRKEVRCAAPCDSAWNSVPWGEMSLSSSLSPSLPLAKVGNHFPAQHPKFQ